MDKVPELIRRMRWAVSQTILSRRHVVRFRPHYRYCEYGAIQFASLAPIAHLGGYRRHLQQCNTCAKTAAVCVAAALKRTLHKLTEQGSSIGVVPTLAQQDFYWSVGREAESVADWALPGLSWYQIYGECGCCGEAVHVSEAYCSLCGLRNGLYWNIAYYALHGATLRQDRKEYCRPRACKGGDGIFCSRCGNPKPPPTVR